jgi:hypothetical protein
MALEEEFKKELVWEALVQKNAVTKEFCHGLICDSKVSKEVLDLAASFLLSNNPMINDWIILSRACISGEFQLRAEKKIRAEQKNLNTQQLREIIAFGRRDFITIELLPLFLSKKPTVDDLFFIFSNTDDTATARDIAEELLKRESDLNDEQLRKISVDERAGFRPTKKAEKILKQRRDQKQLELLVSKTKTELIAILKR